MPPLYSDAFFEALSEIICHMLYHVVNHCSDLCLEFISSSGPHLRYVTLQISLQKVGLRSEENLAASLNHET